MVKIRLARHGAKKNPYYRIIATDSRKRRQGETLEILGYYHPVSRTKEIELKEDRIIQWLNQGAQLTDTIKNILKKSGVLKKWREGAGASEKTEAEATTASADATETAVNSAPETSENKTEESSEDKIESDSKTEESV